MITSGSERDKQLEVLCDGICSCIIIFSFTGSWQHNWEGMFILQLDFIDLCHIFVIVMCY